MIRRFLTLKRLRKRDRMLVFLVLIILGVYLTVTLAVLPQVQKHRTAGIELEEKGKFLADYLDILEEEKVLSKKIASMDKVTRRYDRYFLESTKSALAAAELQNRIKEAAGRYGVVITSEKIATSVKSGGYSIVPVQITATGDVGDLKDFLYDIETGLPLMDTSQMTVRVNKRRKFDPKSRKYTDIEELQITVLINGLMKG
jgi:hypothetical protein